MNDRRTLLKALAGAGIGALTVGAPDDANAYGLVTHHQLFGPIPGNGQVWTSGNLWYQLAGFTANSKEFYFDHNLPPVLWAALTVVWIPTSSAQKVRLTRHNTDPTQLTQMCQIVAAPNAGNPVVQAVDVTAPMQECRTMGALQYLTAGYWGANQQIRLYETRLTVLWDGV